MTDGSFRITHDDSFSSDTYVGNAPTRTHALMCDILDSNAETFDSMLFTACSQYAERFETQELVRQRYLAEQPVSKMEWDSLNIQERVTMIFEQPFRTGYGKVNMGFQSILVLITILAILFETYPTFNPVIFPEQKQSWDAIDGIISCYLLLELVIRAACHPDPVRFFKRFSNLFDLLSCLPFFIAVAVNDSEHRNVAGMLVALRIIRFVKLMRNVHAFRNLVQAMLKSVHYLMAPMILFAMTLLLCSGAIYYAERGHYDANSSRFLTRDCWCETSSTFVTGNAVPDCPPVESAFHSILHTMWMVIAAMTTVGYGDLTPRCPLGMFFTMVSMLIGSIFLSMPIAIVGSYYTMIVNDTREAHAMERGLLKRSSNLSSFDNVGRRPSLGGESPIVVSSKVAAMTAAQRLLVFLSENVSPRSLRGFSFKRPSSDILFYINLYLSDFVDELATCPAALRKTQHRVAELRPIVTKLYGTNKPFRFPRQKDEIYLVKIYAAEKVTVLSEAEAIADFLGNELSPDERHRLLAASDPDYFKLLNGKERSDSTLTFLTSRVVAKVIINVVDPTERREGNLGDVHVKGSIPVDHVVSIALADPASLVTVVEGESLQTSAPTAASDKAADETTKTASFVKSVGRERTSEHSVLQGRTVQPRNTDFLSNDLFFTAAKQLHPGNTVDIRLPALEGDLFTERTITFTFREDDSDFLRHILAYHCALELRKEKVAPEILQSANRATDMRQAAVHATELAFLAEAEVENDLDAVEMRDFSTTQHVTTADADVQWQALFGSRQGRQDERRCVNLEESAPRAGVQSVEFRPTPTSASFRRYRSQVEL